VNVVGVLWLFTEIGGIVDRFGERVAARELDFIRKPAIEDNGNSVAHINISRKLNKLPRSILLN